MSRLTTEDILLEARSNASYDPKFVTKTGWLTDYALSCGYIQLYQCAWLERLNKHCYVVGLPGRPHMKVDFVKLVDARRYYLVAIRAMSRSQV